MAVCDKVYKAVDFDVILIFRHPNSYNSCSPANPSVVVLTYTVGHLQAMFKKKRESKTHTKATQSSIHRLADLAQYQYFFRPIPLC